MEALQAPGANLVTVFCLRLLVLGCSRKNKMGLGWSPVFCESFRRGGQGLKTAVLFSHPLKQSFKDYIFMFETEVHLCPS